jgi:hypothetical protein
MKYKYHVIMPFTRFENLLAVSLILSRAKVWWHPVFNNDIPFGIHNLGWIDPVYAPKAPEGFNPGHFAINWFLDHSELIDDHRYHILCDDDGFEDGFFEKMDAAAGDALLCSMMRGQNQPANGPQYGTATLEAKLENVQVGLVGIEQLMLAGRVMRRYRLGPNAADDGRWVVQVAQENLITFVPNANVWFNYLQPGRWNR